MTTARTILAALLLVATVTAPLQAAAPCGDCDTTDGQVTVLDALAAAQIGVGLATPTSEQNCSCDTNLSGQIDEEAGVHIVGRGTGGSELFHLVVGKTALRGGSFVRRYDANDVFLCAASLRSSVGVWR